MAAIVFRWKVLQDNYDAAPQDASDAVKPSIHHEMPTYQHFQKVSELQDTNETSSTVSQQLMIDKEQESIGPTVRTVTPPPSSASIYLCLFIFGGLYS